jgi:proline racemase
MLPGAQFVRFVSAIDTHTAGGPTRVVLAGALPALARGSAAAQQREFASKHDALRRLLLCEPRGHAGMYGAVVCASDEPEADAAVLFLTAGGSGYLQSCVHSAIGVAAALMQSGAMRPRAGRESLVIETPAGCVSLRPLPAPGAFALRTQPAFVVPDGSLTLHGLTCRLVFSGALIIYVDATQPEAAAHGLELSDAAAGSRLGKQLLATAEEYPRAMHNPATGAPVAPLLVFFFKRLPEHDRESRAAYRSLVVGRTGVVDRSPCGAGSAGLAALLLHDGALQLRHSIAVKGVLGTEFEVQVLERVKQGGVDGCVLEVSGAAFVTGMHQFVLDARDPLSEGFLL